MMMKMNYHGIDILSNKKAGIFRYQLPRYNEPLNFNYITGMQGSGDFWKKIILTGIFIVYQLI